MAPRSPARFLAPLALVAFGIALFMIVTSSSIEPDKEDGGNATQEERPAASPANGEEEDGGSERRCGRQRGCDEPDARYWRSLIR